MRVVDPFENDQNLPMPVDEKPSDWNFETAKGQRIKIVCPICKSDQFVSLGPVDPKVRAGFQHVIMGRMGDGTLQSMPVRSKYCSNCGFVLRFLFPEKSGQ